MSELPRGWAEATVADLASLVQYGSSAKTNQDGRGVPVLRMGNLTSNGQLDLTTLKYLPQDHPEFPALLLEPGDILFNRTNSAELVGKAVTYRGVPTPCSFASYLIRVQLHNTEPDWVTDYLISPAGRRWIASIASQQVGQANVNGSKLKALTLPVAPRAEQRRIVAKIEALQARSRAAREALDAVGPLLEKFRQSVLAAAFRGDLTADWRKKNPNVEPVAKAIARSTVNSRGTRGRDATTTAIEGRAALAVGLPDRPAPPGWKWVALSEIARMESGHTPSRKHPEYWGGDVHWIGIKDARQHHGGYITETLQRTNDKGLANSAARLLPANTVCLSRTASVGYVVIMARPMATSQDFVNWVCSSALDPEFLAFALLAEGDHLLKFGKGTTHTTIYFPEAKALHISLPPLEEQKAIVKRVKSYLESIRALRNQHTAASAALPYLSQSVLAKAFRGELVPQDPNDEPAAALLSKIHAATLSGATPTKRGRKPKAS